MAEETSRGAPTRDPEPDKGIPEEGVQPRGKWANNREFILSMVGQIICVGSICRFPYHCFRNGGVAFLIPYLLFYIFGGLPVFFLETALGQYTSEGGVTAWRKICPMFQGVGIASQVVVSYLNIYMIVLLAWSCLYLYFSFDSPLPWATCDNAWNTDMCHRSKLYDMDIFQPASNWSFLYNTSTSDYFDADYLNDTDDSFLHGFRSSEQEFWIIRVLRMSDDMSLTKVSWDVALCLLALWIVCYVCIWKGIRSAGKVLYFTATLPYLLLVILFFRGVTLPGAADGLKYYLWPDFSRLADSTVWFSAANEVFYSLSVCQGVLTALGSYNKYNNNLYRDCLGLCCLNLATSIFAGCVVFSFLGYLAHGQQVPLEDVAASGYHLIFLAIPKVVSQLPVPTFWAVLFFVMVLVMGVDTQFLCVESLATAITDLFPHYLRRRHAREILVLVMAAVFFLLGLPLITGGGLVLLHVVDLYGCSEITMLFIVCFETIVIGWVYGADRFYDNIEDMIGYSPFPVLKYCWLFITPLICVVTLVFNISQTHTIYLYGYVPGSWTSILGSLILVTPLMCIPAFILISVCKNPANMTKPSSDLRQARPLKPILTLCGCVIFGPQQQPTRSVNEAETMMMEEPKV